MSDMKFQEYMKSSGRRSVPCCPAGRQSGGQGDAEDAVFCCFMKAPEA